LYASKEYIHYLTKKYIHYLTKKFLTGPMLGLK
jgi:hypothetical protein